VKRCLQFILPVQRNARPHTGCNPSRATASYHRRHHRPHHQTSTLPSFAAALPAPTIAQLLGNRAVFEPHMVEFIPKDWKRTAAIPPTVDEEGIAYYGGPARPKPTGEMIHIRKQGGRGRSRLSSYTNPPSRWSKFVGANRCSPWFNLLHLFDGLV
jgi:hypothetical protein